MSFRRGAVLPVAVALESIVVREREFECVFVGVRVDVVARVFAGSTLGVRDGVGSWTFRVR